MTLEQSQQVLFHAFGTTDSISFDNFKSHVTTPSNEVQQLRFTGDSRNTLKQTLSKEVLLPAASFLNRRAQQSSFDARSGCGSGTARHQERPSTTSLVTKKLGLRIHTKIDDDFQIQSSVDADEERHEVAIGGGSGANTVIENADLVDITAMDKAALESFQFVSN